MLRCTTTKASTPAAAREGDQPPMFRHPILLIAAIVGGVLVIGLLAIGAFPPSVEPQPVERTLPNERFQTR